MRVFCAPASVRAVVATVVSTVVVTLAAGCPPPETLPPRCAFGASLDDDDVCGFVWDAQCAEVAEGGCIAGTSLVCAGGALPVYDCAACACADGAACVDEGDVSVCESAAVREAERDDATIDDGLAEEDYVALFRAILDDTGAMTEAEMLDRLRARRAEDPRRANVVVGVDDVSDADQVVAGLFDGSFGGVKSDGGCGDVTGDVLDSATGGEVVIADVDAVSEGTCLQPGVFERCAPPSLSLCAEAKGANAEAVVVVGAARQRAVELALLRNATRSNRDQWGVQISGAIGLYDEVFFRPAAPKFFVDALEGEVRFSVDAGDDRLVWVVVPVHGGGLILATFGLMVSDASIDAFLETHDITPSQCTFVVNASGDDVVETVDVDCAKNGARITGQVAPTVNDTSGLVLSAP